MATNTVDIVSWLPDHSAPTFDAISSRRVPACSPIGALLVGISVVTAPIAFTDLRRDPRLFGTSTTSLAASRRIRRRVSLSEAWTRIGRIQSDAHKRKLQQREYEAERFLSSFLDHDE